MLLHRRPPRLGRALWTSSVLHLAMVLLLFIWGATSDVHAPSQPIDVIMVHMEVPKGPSEEIGLGTVKLDEAVKQPTVETPEATPEETPKDHPQPEAKEPMQTPVPETPKIAAKPKPTKTPTVTKPLTTKEKLEARLTKSTEKLKGLRQGTPGDTHSPGWKEGTGKQPINKIPSNAVLMQYKAQVRARVRRQWSAPSQLKALPPKKRPQAIMRVRINGSGHIVDKGWVKRSGNALMDNSVSRAVGRASPLPAPPAAIRSQIVGQWIVVTFKP